LGRRSEGLKFKEACLRLNARAFSRWGLSAFFQPRWARANTVGRFFAQGIRKTTINQDWRSPLSIALNALPLYLSILKAFPATRHNTNGLMGR